MTALSLGHLPMQVGSVVLAASARAARWIIARYMRQPLANTAIMALLVTSAMAASNALYGQELRHPAPLFAPTGSAKLAGVDPDVAPVVPAQKPKKFAVTQPVPQKTLAPKVAGDAKPAAVATSASQSGGIGNKEVYDLQRKLEQLQLFSGTVDGYYGPQTARAIKKFEQLAGLKQTGQLTPAIMARIIAAPLDIGHKSDGAEAAPQPAARAADKPAQKPAAAATAPAEAVAEIALPRVTATVAADLAPPGAANANLTVAPEPSALPQPTPLAETLPGTEPAAKAESVAVSRRVETDASVETGSVAAAAAATGPTLLGRPLPTNGDQAFQMAADTAAEAFDTIASGVQQLATGEDGGPQPDPIGQLASAAGPLPVTPRPGVPLPLNDAPAAPGTPVAVLDTNATPDQIQKFSPNDPVVIAKVQRGLASLGYLQAAPDGVMNDATAKAIRQFETFYNYQQTGRISPDLLDLLVQNGAAI